MRQNGFAPIIILIVLLLGIATVFVAGKYLPKNLQIASSPTPAASAQNDQMGDYQLTGSEVVRTFNGKKEVVFKNVKNVSAIRIGPDGRSLHFKVNNWQMSELPALCAEWETPVQKVPPNGLQSGVPVSPPWDYTVIGHAYTINSCNTDRSGGFLKNSDFFVYLVLTDAKTGTLYVENLKTGIKNKLTVPSNLLTGFTDGDKSKGNSYWVEPMVGTDGYKYIYPQADVSYQNKKLVLAFGTLVLAVDVDKNSLIGGFPQSDVVSYSFWFLSQKNLPYVVVESAWEGPGVFNEIIDLSGVNIKTIPLKDYDKRSVFGFNVKPLTWEQDRILFNFTDFEEATNKLPPSFDLNKIGEETGASVEKSNKEAEDYLKNNFNYLEVKCNLGFGQFTGCDGLKSINKYQYSNQTGLIKI